MNAWPRASICCSPPERSPAFWSNRSRRTGEVLEDLLGGLGEVLGLLLVEPAGELEVLLDGERGEHALAAGHHGRCRAPRSRSAGRLVMSRPSKMHGAAVGRRPGRDTALSSVDLPAPLVPSRATISPSAMSRSTPKSTWRLAVATRRRRGTAAAPVGPPTPARRSDWASAVWRTRSMSPATNWPPEARMKAPTRKTGTRTRMPPVRPDRVGDGRRPAPGPARRAWPTARRWRSPWRGPGAGARWRRRRRWPG